MATAVVSLIFPCPPLVCQSPLRIEEISKPFPKVRRSTWDVLLVLLGSNEWKGKRVTKKNIDNKTPPTFFVFSRHTNPRCIGRSRPSFWSIFSIVWIQTKRMSFHFVRTWLLWGNWLQISRKRETSGHDNEIKNVSHQVPHPETQKKKKHIKSRTTVTPTKAISDNEFRKLQESFKTYDRDGGDFFMSLIAFYFEAYLWFYECQMVY